MRITITHSSYVKGKFCKWITFKCFVQEPCNFSWRIDSRELLPSVHCSSHTATPKSGADPYFFQKFLHDPINNFWLICLHTFSVFHYISIRMCR